jgi:hypothetical protein
MNTAPIYAFDITLHRAVDGANDPSRRGNMHLDPWGNWPTLTVPHEELGSAMAVDFEDAFDRLRHLDRMFVEPDGSFVWASPREGISWQVDGNAFEKNGRVLLVDLKGSCPADAFDRLLVAFGWPREALMMQLVRPAVFLDESTFRRHAEARGLAGDGETLRPR